MHRPFVVCLFFSFTCFGSLPARAQLLQAEAQMWYMTPSGEVDLDLAGFRSGVDLEDDLGLDDSTATLVLQGSIGDTHRIGFSGFRVDLDTQEALDQSVSFGGLNFNVNDLVDAQAEAQMARGFYRLTLGPDHLRVGLEGGGQYADLSAEAGSSLLGSTRASTQVVIPYGGVHVEVAPLDFLRFQGAYRYSNWAFSDVNASYQQFDLSARVIMVNHIDLGVGYRQLAVDVSKDDTDVDVTFSGPTIFAGVRF